MKFHVTGVLGSGAKYISKVLISAGAECGHKDETVFAGWSDIAPWMTAPYLDQASGVQVIYATRHPKHVIEGLLRTRFFEQSSLARTFIYNQVPGLRSLKTPLEQAVKYVLVWNKLIRAKAPDAIRIPAEIAPERMLTRLKIDLPESPLFSDSKCDYQRFGPPYKVPLATIEGELGAEIRALATEQGYDPEHGSKPKVFWAMPMERNIGYNTVNSVIDIAGIAALKGFRRITVPYMRTDMARNHIVQSFLEISENPDDMVIMLDADHIHPDNILVKLSALGSEFGVVGALAFRRGPPYDPLFYIRNSEGKLRAPAEWEEGALYECAAIATCAIGIRQHVFVKLEEAGFPYPHFRYSYPEESNFRQTEDIFFARRCEEAGISQWCDTSTISPHLSIVAIAKDDWDRYILERPHLVSKE